MASVVNVVERASWKCVVRKVADSLERGGFNAVEVVRGRAKLGDVRKTRGGSNVV